MKHLRNNGGLYLAVLACLVFSVFFFGLDRQTGGAAQTGATAQTGAAAQTAGQSAREKLYALHPTLPIGSSAPDFSVVDAHGKKYQLSDYDKYPILMIIWACNHCPEYQLYEDRVQKLYDDYTPKGVAVIAINADAATAAPPSNLGWTDVDDSLPGMPIRQNLRHLTYPYLYDGFTQAMALKYGPKTTPDVFIFDKDRKLQYEGRIDDNNVEPVAKTHDARAALDQMLAGQPVSVPHTASFGCHMDWLDQTEARQKETAVWEARPVTVESATPDVLKELRANSTGKTTLVTFWSTKCARCEAEFPDLLATYRWYRTTNVTPSRPFDMVTVSTDGPAAQAEVQKFLESQHSAVRNLQFGSTNVSALQQAFAGKTWDTHQPYTVVIQPGFPIGNVIYEANNKDGDDIFHMRRVILANMDEAGRFRGTADYWANNLRMEELEAKK